MDILTGPIDNGTFDCLDDVDIDIINNGSGGCGGGGGGCGGLEFEK